MDLKDILRPPKPPRYLVLHNFTDEQVEKILALNASFYVDTELNNLFTSKKRDLNNNELVAKEIHKIQGMIKEELEYLKNLKHYDSLTNEEIIWFLNEAAYGTLKENGLSGITWDINNYRHPWCCQCMSLSPECKCAGGPCVELYGDDVDKYRTCKTCKCRGSWEHEFQIISPEEAHRMNNKKEKEETERKSEKVTWNFNNINRLNKIN